MRKWKTSFLAEPCRKRMPMERLGCPWRGSGAVGDDMVVRAERLATIPPQWELPPPGPEPSQPPRKQRPRLDKG